MLGDNHFFTDTSKAMTQNNSTELTPLSAAVLALGAAACVTGAVAGVVVKPEDITTSVQQASEQMQTAVQDYLGTNNCKR